VPGRRTSLPGRSGARGAGSSRAGAPGRCASSAPSGEEQDGVYAFQHYGIVKGRRLKHWREEWRGHPDGAFTQTVLGPSENLRYTCTAPFQFNQWRCATPGAPKPLRDRERTDYQTLDRENTLQLTPQGWVQAEHNTKRTAAGVAVANELGWNEYRRVDEGRCRPSGE
jgi:hypothetical protein